MSATEKYVLSVDQSTQGTKALLFDRQGKLIARATLPHRQIVNEKGWVSHDLNEIYTNTVQAVRNVVEKAGIPKDSIVSFGISNQRETSAAWDRDTMEPVAPAIVWQCSRAAAICEEVSADPKKAAAIRERTGIPVSPYFPASKFAWLLRNAPGVRYDEQSVNAVNKTFTVPDPSSKRRLAFGTIDTWLIYRLTGGKEYRTDYSNASRTQLFNIRELKWDKEICRWFGLDAGDLAKVCDSDSVFGETDFDGYLNHPIPIHAVLGDSHAALFGQGCLRGGMAKATYGTGSSIMMNIGAKPVFSRSGLVTSLAWKQNGAVNYVLEGNINYAAAVITWLKDDLHLIASAGETEALAKQANPEDTTLLVPAFSGLGAPYWCSGAKASISGMTRTTGKNEIVKAAVESIGFQIADVLRAMEKDTGIKIAQLRVDGGPTKNRYLMQFQSDISGSHVAVPADEELSGIGAAYMAGIASGLYDDAVFDMLHYTEYAPQMPATDKRRKITAWKKAVKAVVRK